MKSLNTFLLVDKPPTWTSFDVCARLRKILNVKRIGHTGTLDPFATGLLIVAVGKCTKLIPLLEKDRKTYRTKILLGKTSETLDPEGEMVECRVSSVELEKAQRMTVEEVQAFLHQNFFGKIEQVPPQYSALKVGGKRAYDLARKGEKVKLKPRQTEVFDIKILSYNFPELEAELTVAAGFYVRSFARDVGQALVGGGLCAALRRIGVGEVIMQNEECVIKNAFDSPTAGGSGRGADKTEKKFKLLTQLELKTGEFLLEDYAIDPQFLINNIVHQAILPERLPDLQAGRAVKFSSEECRVPNSEKLLLICEGQTVGMGEMIGGSVQPRVVF